MGMSELARELPRYLDLTNLIPSPSAVACIDSACASRHKVVPLALIEHSGSQTLLLATADIQDFTLRERLRKYVAPHIAMQWCQVAARQIDDAIERCYQKSSSIQDLLINAQCALPATTQFLNNDNFYIHLLESILLLAYQQNASDVHFSPGADNVSVRFRLDGVLQHLGSVHIHAYQGLLVRLKVVAGLDIAEARLPQDGQFQHLIDGYYINFRASTFPVSGGENTVLRLIGEHTQLHSLSDLKLDNSVQQIVSRVCANPDGMIVVCGPTGSGKSTTLFAMLAEKDETELNIMTLEDPVEHRVTGITQTRIDDSRGFSYSKALRAILRQDPDVLLVGEVRDQDSCAMALRAVMTGHQVFTTVHANSAHGALIRLLELGAQPGVLAVGLSMILSQRLLRLGCKNCVDSAMPEPDCDQCHGSGYAGRQVITEVLVITPGLSECIARGGSMAELKTLSRQQGFVELAEQTFS